MSLGHHPDDTGATVPPQELVQRLRELDEEMPEALNAQLLAAVADDQVEHGWVPSHTAKLLGALGDARAVPVLLCCLERCDTLDPLSQQVTDAMVTLGKLAIDECLEAYTTTNDDMCDSLAVVLSRCATQDERIYKVLLDALERSPILGANCLIAHVSDAVG